jgi:hypothetical protein
MRWIGALVTCLAVFLNLTAAYALPKRIIILRHAEKINDGDLCAIGNMRASALAKRYLGYGAWDSLFANGEQPAAFYANSPHAAETIEPAFLTWRRINRIHFDKNLSINTWSRVAAEEILGNYHNQIVVMAWEHSRIANSERDLVNPDPVSLYYILGLSKYNKPLPIRLDNWCGSNYDYFWIVDYNPDEEYTGTPPTPTNITVKLQELRGLPQNKWGEKEEPWPADCTATDKPTCTPQQGE